MRVEGRSVVVRYINGTGKDGWPKTDHLPLSCEPPSPTCPSFSIAISLAPPHVESPDFRAWVTKSSTVPSNLSHTLNHRRRSPLRVPVFPTLWSSMRIFLLAEVEHAVVAMVAGKWKLEAGGSQARLPRITATEFERRDFVPTECV